MSINKMSNDTKEFYLKKVEKYNQDLPTAKKQIAVGKVILAIGGIYVLINILGMTSDVPLVRYALHIAMSSASLAGIIALISGIAKKAKIEARIDEIKDFFEQHGLVLEDEVSKGRSK